MRVLILGGNGMLGHVLATVCRPRFETYVTVRREFARYRELRVLDPARTLDNVDAAALSDVARALDRVAPDVAVNCIGLVKQRDEARDVVASLTVNALFPHRLAAECARRAIRVIHLSTDCVFSGRRGAYRESDPPDPEDLYGRSKLLGELDRPGCLTVRTSMIGMELGTRHGLLEWLLGQRGKVVPGFRRAIFSGLTTTALSRILVRLIEEHPRLEGIWHVGSEPISKHDLLVRIRDALALDVEIAPDDAHVCDRSLDSARFRQHTGIEPPPWRAMLDELAADVRRASRRTPC